MKTTRLFRSVKISRLLALAAVIATTAGCPGTPATDASVRDVAREADAVADAASVMDSVTTDVQAAADTRVPDVAPLPDTGPVDAPPWDGGSAMIRAAHPRIYLLDAQLTRLRGLLAASDPAAVRFRTMVDSQLGGGNVYAFESWYAALMFQLTGEVRYATYAVNRLDAEVTAEEARVAGGMNAEVAADSYLHVGERIGDLALTYDWCYERLTPAQRTRWLRYANQAVSNVWNHMTATWGGRSYPWSGWSVDNPVNNYYFSFLRATMLLGLAEYSDDPQSALWISTFRTAKIAGQLVPTYRRDLIGGGSREGTGYGTAMAHLFRLYDVWESSTGERIAPLTPHALASLPFMIHSTMPTVDRIAPIGDHARDSTAELFDYHRDYTQVLMWLFRDDPLAGYGRSFLQASSLPRVGSGFMFYSDFLYSNPALTARPLTELNLAYYGSGTGNVFVRTAWDRTATWANFIAGPFTESHAHQDQGSFLIYRNEWLAYDQNINSHSGIVSEVRAHNLVRIESAGVPVEMRESETAGQLLALHDDAVFTYFAANTAGAYGGRMGITRVDREIVFVKPDAFVVFDRVRATGSRRVWQLNTPVRPVVSGRTVTIQGTTSSLRVHSLLPAAAPISVVDWAMTDTDMLRGFRVDITDATADSSLFLTVLSLDDTVATVAAADSAGMHGARLTFRNGRAATVVFSDAAPGATVDVRRMDGSTAFSGPVMLRVDTPPLRAP